MVTFLLCRKPFLKLQKKTLRQFQGKNLNKTIILVSPIIKIPNKDDVLAVLAADDDCSDKKGLTFIINDREVRLNDKKINISEIVNITERDAAVFLSNNSSSAVTLSDSKDIGEMISKTLQNVSLSDKETFTNYVARVLGCSSEDIRLKIVKTFVSLLKKMDSSIEQALDEIFRDQSKYFRIMDVIVCFFAKKAERLKDQWKTWLDTRKEEYYLPFFEQIDEEDSDGLQFFEKAVDMSCNGSFLNDETEEAFLYYLYNWLAKQVYDNQERLEKEWRKREKSSASPTEKVSCNLCGGYFYRISKKK